MLVRYTKSQGTHRELYVRHWSNFFCFSRHVYTGNRRSHGCGPYHFSSLDLLFSPGNVFHVVTFQKTTILMSFPGILSHAQILNNLTADHVIWRTDGLEVSPQLS